MRLSHFDFLAPASIEEAIGLLQSKGADARLIAGGTGLLMKIKLGAIKPRLIISLNKTYGLDQISFDGTRGLTIGATALPADHPDILKHYPTVAQAASGTVNVQVRNATRPS